MTAFRCRRSATCLHRVFPERAQILSVILHYMAVKLWGCRVEAINTEAEREREVEWSDRDWRLLLSAGHHLNGTALSSHHSLMFSLEAGEGGGGFKLRPPRTSNNTLDAGIFVKSINTPPKRRRFLLTCITSRRRCSLWRVAPQWDCYACGFNVYLRHLP